MESEINFCAIIDILSLVIALTAQNDSEQPGCFNVSHLQFCCEPGKILPPIMLQLMSVYHKPPAHGDSNGSQ